MGSVVFSFQSQVACLTPHPSETVGSAVAGDLCVATGLSCLRGRVSGPVAGTAVGRGRSCLEVQSRTLTVPDAPQ